MTITLNLTDQKAIDAISGAKEGDSVEVTGTVVSNDGDTMECDATDAEMGEGNSEDTGADTSTEGESGMPMKGSMKGPMPMMGAPKAIRKLSGTA